MPTYIIENYGSWQLVLDIIAQYPKVRQHILEDRYPKVWQYILEDRHFYPMFMDFWNFFVVKCKGVWFLFKTILADYKKTEDESIAWDVLSNYLTFFFDDLKELRQDMADALADWLKPLPKSKQGNLEKRLVQFSPEAQAREGFDIAYTEPDPVWRTAYARAIGDLGVDVDGKGHYLHSILDKAAKKDPSAMVREAAEKTTAELKRLRNGWDGNEHGKNIVKALWWFKQAHCLARNIPINKPEMRKERNQEIRRWHEKYQTPAIKNRESIGGGIIRELMVEPEYADSALCKIMVKNQDQLDNEYDFELRYEHFEEYFGDEAGKREWEQVLQWVERGRQAREKLIRARLGLPARTEE